MAFEEALDRPEAEGQALVCQAPPHLFDGSVPFRPERRDHDIPLGFDPARATVAAQRLGPGITLLSGSTLAVMAVAAVWELRPAANVESF
jgi:hypothetical protein